MGDLLEVLYFLRGNFLVERQLLVVAANVVVEAVRNAADFVLMLKLGEERGHVIVAVGGPGVTWAAWYVGPKGDHLWVVEVCALLIGLRNGVPVFKLSHLLL